MINYARLTPVCSANIFSLKGKDPETWSMLNKGNFFVNKTLISFSAIGVEQSISWEVLIDSAPPAVVTSLLFPYDHKLLLVACR